MSRERFDELVEGYARGELRPQEAREFLGLVEVNLDWAREAEQTREIVRLARLHPAPIAPPGLLHGALNLARSSKGDWTPNADAPSSANVILVPGTNGNMRRIPIHVENAPTSVAQADPQPDRGNWPRVNWGMAAAIVAVVGLGGMLAIEIGPALMGQRPQRVVRPEEQTYLATSTIYESELGTNSRARMNTNAEEPPGLAATLAQQPGSRFDPVNVGREVGQDADPGVMGSADGGPSPTFPTSDPDAAALRFRLDRQVAALVQESADGPVFTPEDMPNQFFARSEASDHPHDRLNARPREQFQTAEASRTPLDTRDTALPSEMGGGFSASADASELFVGEVDAQAAAKLATPASEAPALASAAESEWQQPPAPQSEERQPQVPQPRHLSSTEVEFLLAQARTAGGDEAPRMGTGFAPLPLDDEAKEERTELAMVFPDRGSYESFLARVRIPPLSVVGEPATTSRGEVYRVTQPANARRHPAYGRESSMPSPVTGFAAPTPSRSGSAPSSASTPSAWNLTDEADTGSDPHPELGKPLDLSSYHLHLTTDVQTGQVRVTLRPLVPTANDNSAAPARSPGAPSGVRRY